MSDKIVTYEELKAHGTQDSLYLLISGKGRQSPDCYTLSLLTTHTVYDVTKFIDEVGITDKNVLYSVSSTMA